MVSHGTNCDKTLKIILLGNSGVGKSSLVERFLLGTFTAQSTATVGVEMKEKCISVDGEHSFTLQIWDTAGQERFHSLRTPFYRGAHACMLVFSLDNRKSFDQLDNWLEELKTHAHLPDLHRFPVVIVGNKADVPVQLDTASVQYRNENDSQTKREVSETEAFQWSCSRGPYPYMESSAKDTVNVTQAFEAVVRTWTNLASPVNGQLSNEHVLNKNDTPAIRVGQARGGQSSSTCCK